MIDKELFKARREQFMSRMDGGIALFFAAPVFIRNHDVEFEYRQDSNFYYLTGFEEPESICVLAPEHDDARFMLFVRARDKARETWTGHRAGAEGAMEVYGADKAWTVDQAEAMLKDLLGNTGKLYYSIGKYAEADARILALYRALSAMYRVGIHPPAEMVDPASILWDMRLFKQPADLKLLQQAIDISALGHRAAMEAAAPGKYEYQVQAAMEYTFRRNGSQRNGYPSIVGSGPNGTILHYIENNRQIRDGELVLIDAGAEYGYFSADITRTFPAGGKFTAEQKAVYSAVLSAQKKAIQMCRPGNTVMAVHDVALLALVESMVDLGLLQGNVQENIENKTYEKYYMHRTSHWLGMDVHDVGKYKNGDQWRKLEEGMVLTVEPGIYIGADDEHERFRNTGIRIEDDVLITRQGCEVLTAACPKEVGDLEELIGKKASVF